MLLLSTFSILSLSATYDFVTSENPQMYSFDCKEGVTFRYMPLEGYKLVLRSSKEVECLRISLTDNEVSKLPLNLEKKDNYFESEELSLELEPANFTCQCSTPTGNCAISPVVVQNVTSSTIILVLQIFSIILISIDICIIVFQFLTFHHRKSD